jgi:glycosyltransferase involved in cell wall biosynthesis
MNKKVAVSVVVITKNEQDRIRKCLESVYGWADEIVIVDDESTDNTLNIAKEFTDRIFIRKMDIEGRHRNWAYAQAKNEWVLSLDADERVTEELKDEITRVLMKDLGYVGFSIPRQNYLGSYWIKYGGLYPAGQLKLFKKDRFRYEEVEVHPRVFLDGETGHLISDIIHYSWRDFEDFLIKLNRQTTYEAKKWINTNRQMSFAHALWRAWDRFWRTLLRKKSYKDGLIGFMVAYFASFYQIISYAKYWQMKKEKRR